MSTSSEWLIGSEERGACGGRWNIVISISAVAETKPVWEFLLPAWIGVAYSIKAVYLSGVFN